MKSKNKFWSFVRLVYEVRYTQRKYYECKNGLDKRTWLKKSLALESKLDKGLIEIFESFPEESPERFKIENAKHNPLDSWLAQ